ncbi:MAG: aminopeptidase, partial [Chloroflexota bacterium]
MADLRVEKLAQLLVGYSVAVREGDRVVINGSTLAEPLLKEIYIRVLQAGGHPLMMVSLTDIEETFFRYASDEQLKHV